MIRSRRIRLFLVTLLTTGALGLGWLAPLRWLKGPALRAMIPVGTDHWGPYLGGLVFAPSGTVVATIGRVLPERGGPLAVRLWDCSTGRLRAELLRRDADQLKNVEFSTDGKRIRVILNGPVDSDAGAKSAGKAPGDSCLCWDVETATTCDPNEPFLPFSCECGLPTDEAGRTAATFSSRSVVDCAPKANAVVYLAGDELHIEYAGHPSERKITDAPWGPITWFAISPDANQLVMNGPPHIYSSWPLVDRVRYWFDPQFDKYGISDAVTYVVNVANGRPVVCWATPGVDVYKFSPDGRTLAVVTAEQTAFYDAPFREPWLQRLAIGLAAGIVTFLLSRFVLTPRSSTSWLWKIVRLPLASRKASA